MANTLRYKARSESVGIVIAVVLNLEYPFGLDQSAVFYGVGVRDYIETIEGDQIVYFFIYSGLPFIRMLRCLCFFDGLGLINEYPRRTAERELRQRLVTQVLISIIVVGWNPYWPGNHLPCRHNQLVGSLVA